MSNPDQFPVFGFGPATGLEVADQLHPLVPTLNDRLDPLIAAVRTVQSDSRFSALNLDGLVFKWDILPLYQAIRRSGNTTPSPDQLQQMRPLIDTVLAELLRIVGRFEQVGQVPDVDKQPLAVLTTFLDLYVRGRAAHGFTPAEAEMAKQSPSSYWN